MKTKIFKILILTILTVAIFATFSACDSKEVDIPLQKPENLTIENGVLTWDKIEEADNYTVEVTIDEETYTVQANGNSLIDLPQGKEIKVKVKASNFFEQSQFSDVFSFTILEAPTNFIYFNEKFYWDMKEGSESYVVEADGELIQLKNVANQEYIFNKGGEISARIKTVGNGVTTFDSPYSDFFTARIPTTLWEEYNPIKPLGEGSKSAPYRIKTIENIAWVSEKININHKDFLGEFFVLENDIDFKYVTGFIPIGNSNVNFQGKFEGNGNAIKNLVIESDVAGFIGVLGSSGSISNFVRDGGETKASFNAGGIVGTNYGSVYNCVNSSKVSGRNAGGIVGENTDGKAVLYSTNLSLVEGNTAGGIVGMNWNGYVSNCKNFGEIVGVNLGGGIAGSSYGSIDKAQNEGSVYAFNSAGIAGESYGNIIYSSNKGEISGTKYVGGLASINDGTISKSYNWGKIKGVGSNEEIFVGGLIGKTDEGEISSSYQAGEVENSSSARKVYIGLVAGYYRSGLLQDLFYLNETHQPLGNSQTYIGNIENIKFDYLLSKEFTTTLNKASINSGENSDIWNHKIEGYPIFIWEEK